MTLTPQNSGTHCAQLRKISSKAVKYSKPINGPKNVATPPTIAAATSLNMRMELKSNGLIEPLKFA